MRLSSSQRRALQLAHSHSSGSGDSAQADAAGGEVHGRRKPATLTVHSDLTGLLVVKHARKSTSDPKNPGKSVLDQFSVLDEQTEKFGLIEFARVTEDEQGASRYSRNIDREKLEETKQYIKNNPIAVVAFWKLNRGFRRQRVFGEFLELCQDRNVLILESGRLLDPRSPSDALQLGISSVVDEHMVAASRQDTLRGIAAVAEAGLPHGVSPYGYTRVYNKKRQLVRIEVDPVESAILLEIHERVVDNPEVRNANGQRVNSATAMARELNGRSEAVRPRGGAWTSSVIKETLLLPAYYGRRSHIIQETQEVRMFQGIWPSIFTPEQEVRTLQHFKKNAEAVGSWDTNAKYLLTGVAFCVNDHPMYFEEKWYKWKGTKYASHQYVCSDRHCRISRNAAHLERHVLTFVGQFLASPEFAEVERADLGNEEARTDHDRLQVLLQEQSNDETDLRNRVISARAFTLSEEARLPLIDELRKKIESRRAADSIFAQVRQLNGSPLSDMTMAEQRTVLKKLVTAVCLPTSRRGRGFDETSVLVRPRLL